MWKLETQFNDFFFIFFFQSNIDSAKETSHKIHARLSDEGNKCTKQTYIQMYKTALKL